jgi:phage shock protein A
MKQYKDVELQSKRVREKIAGLEKECGEQQASQSTPISNLPQQLWNSNNLYNLGKELEERVGRLEERVGRLEERVGRLEERVGRLEERVGRLESDLEGWQ